MGLFLSGRANAASGQSTLTRTNMGASPGISCLSPSGQTDALRTEELLAFAPASTAIDASQACHDQIPRRCRTSAPRSSSSTPTRASSSHAPRAEPT
jgi:hypothetical protein